MDMGLFLAIVICFIFMSLVIFTLHKAIKKYKFLADNENDFENGKLDFSISVKAEKSYRNNIIVAILATYFSTPFIAIILESLGFYHLNAYWIQCKDFIEMLWLIGSFAIIILLVGIRIINIKMRKSILRNDYSVRKELLRLKKNKKKMMAIIYVIVAILCISMIIVIYTI